MPKDKTTEKQLVRVKYWLQETLESGKFVYARPMSLEGAKRLIKSGLVERGTIISDEEKRIKCTE